MVTGGLNSHAGALAVCAAAAALKLRKGDGLARGCDDAKSCGIITKQSFRYKLYTSSLKLNIGTSKWWVPECITSLMGMIDFITQYLRKEKKNNRQKTQRNPYCWSVLFKKWVFINHR